MTEYIPGQRWISDAESQLGLGTVLRVGDRTVTVVFQAAGETRTYARQSAPLTRVAFAVGDRVQSHQGWSLEIHAVQEHAGLLSYAGSREDGREARLDESELDHFIQLNRPSDRLFSGQFDPHKWFELRYQTRVQLDRLLHSGLHGLTGARTSLIPHQLFIAHEVASRHAPRVLLADEVGLGKTIEAGLILHHQLLNDRARRCLIVVPETLTHQWLVEMIRRFNLYFSILDEARCLAIEDSGEQDNPFEAAQQVITSLDLLSSRPARLQQALAAGWDMLIVDEAHHLQWSPEGASMEYGAIERLASATPSVLLLTATPEQLGKAGHFARLRLLDPDRFPDFEGFIAEERAYAPIAAAVTALLAAGPLPESARRTLLGTLGEGDNRRLLEVLEDASAGADAHARARDALIQHLLDRHGTGRVLFRNTRAAVQGFPQRRLHSHPLPLPGAYADCLARYQDSSMDDPGLLLAPERLYRATGERHAAPWTRIDPRIEWLLASLKRLRPAKVLVIAASADTTLDIADALRAKAGIHAAVFHERMSLIERDRAAAHFADLDYGTQVLLCSEIGSEGRNFQFAHHLVLFDLPLNPDLLEQRIGRLDRIGQSETIQIHLPYLRHSAQEVMFRWYHEGLSAFEHTCPAGQSVFSELRVPLLESLHQIDSAMEDLPELIAATRARRRQLGALLQQGRDRLLEYNSCRPEPALALCQRARDQDRESTLPSYLELLFDCYGVEIEEHRAGSHVLRPGAQMQDASFPGLHGEGMTVTWRRDIALANEDMQFLTWEHPLVSGAMEMVTSNEAGNTAITTIRHAGVRPGTLMLECLYILEGAASGARSSSRYLPATPIRVLLDSGGADLADSIPHALIGAQHEPVEAKTARKISHACRETLRGMLRQAETRARQQAPAILEAAHARADQTLTGEIDRLRALRRVNPNIRAQEIEFLEDERRTLNQAIASARPRLDALRVIIAT